MQTRLVLRFAIGSTKDEVIELLNEPVKINHFQYHRGVKEVSGDKYPMNNGSTVDSH